MESVFKVWRRVPQHVGITAEGLTEGEWSLTLNKPEIDRAAKDDRCAHFDPDFRVERLLNPLPGEAGTGPARDAAREAAEAAAAAAGSTAGAIFEAEDANVQPLQADREAYQRHVQAGFYAWLLGEDAPTRGSSLVLPPPLAESGTLTWSFPRDRNPMEVQICM
jgi:hypothetical protein